MVEESGPSDRIVVDGSNVRALAHPLRVSLLGRLRSHGRATASQLAKAFDTTSGDVSYHLRQLERFGFISEDSGYGNRRERWWRANHRITEFDSYALDPAAREVGQLFDAEIVRHALDRLARAARTRPDWPAEWQPRFGVSDIMLVLTPDEAEELQSRVLALIESYPLHRPDQPVPEGRSRVTIQLQTFLDDEEQRPDDEQR